MNRYILKILLLVAVFPLIAMERPTIIIRNVTNNTNKEVKVGFSLNNVITIAPGQTWAWNENISFINAPEQFVKQLYGYQGYDNFTIVFMSLSQNKIKIYDLSIFHRNFILPLPEQGEKLLVDIIIRNGLFNKPEIKPALERFSKKYCCTFAAIDDLRKNQNSLFFHLPKEIVNELGKYMVVTVGYKVEDDMWVASLTPEEEVIKIATQ